ncbi:MAG TPA: NAD(P)/FAD-dependent oxidoreductase [Candidatus Binatia bacterium]
MTDTSFRPRQIAIIGSGFSGLCLAIQLKRAGIDSFTIFEKSHRLGGTWRDNTYPGAACDVPSFSYCFSFAQKTDWTRKWSPQSEIQIYMEGCARTHDVLRHIRFDTEIASARFDEHAGVWHLRTATGEEIVADILVSAVGQLNRPAIPAIPGLETFRGERFHSARWNHAYDLTDKRVGVIGNAASAIQFIPQIAPRVRDLTIFQRSANWMLPRRDRTYTDREKRVFTRFPSLARLYRWLLWMSYESQFPAFRGNRAMQALMRKAAMKNIETEIPDPALRAVLVPDYPIGAKRVLISDDYYQALGRPNVHVVTGGIDHVTADALVTRDGVAHPVDAIVLATGFQSTAFLAPMRIEGRGGRTLETEWQGGAHAYLGITVAGFPNFFMMYGPNTNLGHNSIIFMIECQTSYILQAIGWLSEGGRAWGDLRPEVMETYNTALRAELAGSVWARVAKSWYVNEQGVITNNWSGTTIRYWWRTRRFDPALYESRAAAAAGAVGVAASVAATSPPAAA